jgi:cytidylate kinase
VAELLGYTYLDSGAMYRALALKAIRHGLPLGAAAKLESLAAHTRIDLLPSENGPSGAKAPVQPADMNVAAEAATHKATPGDTSEVSAGDTSEATAGDTSDAAPSKPTKAATSSASSATSRNSSGGIRVLLDGADVTAEIRTPEVAQSASKIAVLAGVRKHLVAEQRRAGAGGGVVMEGRDIGTAVFPDADLKIYLDASAEARAERRQQEHVAKGEKISLAHVAAEVRERDRRDKEREASPLVRAEDAVLVDNTAMDVEETARLIVLLAREKISEGK